MVEVQAFEPICGWPGRHERQAIDVALRIADQAVTGRPMLGPGPYPTMPPGAAYPPAGYPPSGSYPESPGGSQRPEGPAPPPGAMPPPPPSPPAGGPSPYQICHPDMRGTRRHRKASAGSCGCQTLRQSASASESVTDMLRAAECWSRQPTWPGWARQVTGGARLGGDLRATRSRLQRPRHRDRQDPRTRQSNGYRRTDVRDDQPRPNARNAIAAGCEARTSAGSSGLAGCTSRRFSIVVSAP